jgi:hypothetical protein
VVSVNEAQAAGAISVYPNPFSTTATIALNLPSLKGVQGILEFRMYDIFGKEVRKFKVEDQKFRLDRGNLSAGIYFYKITSGNETVCSGKLMIE